MNLLEKNKLGPKDRYAYKLIAPSIIYLFFILIVPLMFSLFLSSYDWSLIGNLRKFVGLNNYLKILSDKEVIHSLIITLVFVFVSVSVEFILGLGIALLLNQPFKGEKIIRVILLLPMMISPTIVALGWRLILNSEKGVLNYLITLLGIHPQVWLGPDLALPTIIAVEIWISTPFFMLIILAALKSIPESLIEAAIVDGANWWQRLTKVTLPMIRSITMVAFVFRTMFALRNFDLPWVLTSGGPANRTNVFSIELYRQAFSYYQIGNAAAMSWILLVITIIISIFYIKIIERQESLY